MLGFLSPPAHYGTHNDVVIDLLSIRAAGKKNALAGTAIFIRNNISVIIFFVHNCVHACTPVTTCIGLNADVQ